MKKTTLSRHERADDIARLKADLNLSDLHYVDISAQLELSQAYKRWPLLSEMAVAVEQALPESGQDVLPVAREARQ